MAHQDVIKRMIEMAEAFQSETTVIQGLHEAFSYAVDITERQGGHSIASPGLADGDQGSLQELCRSKGLTLFTGNLRDHMGELHTGLTWVDWGVAETGTLVMEARSEDLRMATMLTETHVAVLPFSRILPHMEALEEEFNRIFKTPPSYLSFITGPSRTADIERVLTIGVHGPRELHILLLEDTGTIP